MKALSLWQPWATLLAIGAKTIETRSWYTSYRGLLAIHATKAFPRAARNMIWEQPVFRRALLKGLGEDWFPPLNAARGHVIATCQLVTVVSTSQMTNGGCWWDGPDGRRYDYRLSEQERAFGDYSNGRYAWLLADVQLLPTPIPASGHLGLWDWQPPPGVHVL